MINVNGLKRNAKNIVKKYSYAQIKVREATSNDPWGPSSTIMAEIADMTENVVAFSEIMQMLWIRLNDHGRNWRHVYKALVVLEYLLKTGSERVAQQCQENIITIETLRDFQYMENNKDQGVKVREKSKKLVALLKDPEKLKSERARAMKAKSRLAESISSVGLGSFSGHFGGDGAMGMSGGQKQPSYNPYFDEIRDIGPNSTTGPHFIDDSEELARHKANLARLTSDMALQSARPLTASEEDSQLRLALALSRQEAEKQEALRRNDELRLKLALSVSKKTAPISQTTNLILDDSLQNNTSTSSSNSSTASFAPNPISTITTNSSFIKTSELNSDSSSFKSANHQQQKKVKSSNIDDLLGLSIMPPVTTNNNADQDSDPWSPAATNKQQVTSMISQASSSLASPFSSIVSQHIPVTQTNSMDPWQTVQPDTSSTTSVQPTTFESTNVSTGINNNNLNADGENNNTTSNNININNNNNNNNNTINDIRSLMSSPLTSIDSITTFTANHNQKPRSMSKNPFED